ncbi:MAG: protein phosphatase 2C domain-containing protein, partial [Acidobacteriota bacterium]
EVASRMAVETVRDLMLRLQAHPVHAQIPFAERLRVAIEQANETIHQESLSNPLHKGLGATFTAVATIGADAYFAQVGDSRAYLIRRGNIFRITKDQSLVQQLIDAGQITEEEAETHSYRNVILQALGAHSQVNVEMNTITLCHLDILVICSDGLSGKISEPEIAVIVSDSVDFQAASRRLIDLANARGGEDNITVVIAQFIGVEMAEARSGTVAPLALLRSPATPNQLNWLSGGEAGIESGRSDIDQRPAPPLEVIPFTTPAERVRKERRLTNDLSDRRGPITAVFSFDELEPAAVSPASPAPPQSTAYVRSTNVKRSSSNEKAPRGVLTNLKQWLIATVIVVSLTLFGMGAMAYIKRQERARQQLEISQLSTQKETQINLHRQKLEQIRKRLDVQPSDKPALKAKLNSLQEQFVRISQRLDSVSLMDPQTPEQINQACDEINRELQKIEDDLNNLQGLLPRSLFMKDPIRI